MKESFRGKLVRLADELAQEVYPLTLGFPKYGRYALGNQLRRAIISVPANTIEGFQQRGYQGTLKRYALIAYGSLGESKYLIYFAYKQGYIRKEVYLGIKGKAEELSKLFWSFIKIKNL